LNAHGVFPTWIALNNGSVHGIEATGGGIDTGLTAKIHKEIEKYGVWGAQHGTSGNNYDKLRAIVNDTNTTKANVATALQMVSWGVKVNEYGNAELDSDKNFIKQSDKGVSQETWDKMMSLAKEKDWSGGNMKKLNLAADEIMKAQPAEIQRRMAQDVEDFITNLFNNVFNCEGTANLALDAILEAKSASIPSFNEVIEDKSKWTQDYIRTEGQKLLAEQDQIEGDFDD
jgi:fructose-bisphosphate aldolase class II